jgi:hypothetical protein
VAFIQDHIWEDFFNSVYPTISSGKTSKIIMVSTPKGMNHFFNIYNDAARGKSNFYAVKIPWWERPDRDEAWKEEQLRNMSQINFNQEFGCFRDSTFMDIDGRTISIGDLFNSCEESVSIGFIEIKKNEFNFKVSTPNGYKSFSGIAKLPNHTNLLKFELENGLSVEVTKDHSFQILSIEILASDLKIGDTLQTVSGLSKIISISEEYFNKKLSDNLSFIIAIFLELDSTDSSFCSDKSLSIFLPK